MITKAAYHAGRADAYDDENPLTIDALRARGTQHLEQRLVRVPHQHA